MEREKNLLELVQWRWSWRKSEGMTLPPFFGEIIDFVSLSNKFLQPFFPYHTTPSSFYMILFLTFINAPRLNKKSKYVKVCEAFDFVTGSFTPRFITQLYDWFLNVLVFLWTFSYLWRIFMSFFIFLSCFILKISILFYDVLPNTYN